MALGKYLVDEIQLKPHVFFKKFSGSVAYEWNTVQTEIFTMFVQLVELVENFIIYIPSLVFLKTAMNTALTEEKFRNLLKQLCNLATQLIK